MGASIEQLKSTLAGLSAAERTELADFLLDSLGDDGDEVKNEWLALAEQRMAEIRAGGVVGIPAD